MWLNGELIPWKEGRVHPMSHSLNYGTGFFEGIRFYQTDSGMAIFRLEDHIHRLFRSSSLYGVEIPYSLEEICSACISVLKSGGNFQNGYIRPLIYLETEDLKIFPKNPKVNLVIGAFEWEVNLGENTTKEVRAGVSSWRKFSSSSIPTNAKVGGQYLNSILASLEVRRQGYDEAILLNDEGNISEGAGQNIFFVKDGIVITNDENSSILNGITRDTILFLCRKKQRKFQIRNISLKDLLSADEVFFTATASEVTPIISIDKKKIGNGKIGDITSDIRDAYLATVLGEHPETSHFLTYLE